MAVPSVGVWPFIYCCIISSELSEKETTDEEFDWRNMLKKAHVSEYEEIAKTHGFELKSVLTETELEEAFKRGKVEFEEVTPFIINNQGIVFACVLTLSDNT